ADLGQILVAGQARRDRVDSAAVAGRVHRSAPGQRHHTGFRGGVVGLALLCAPADDGGVVDHGTGAALRLELAQGRTGAAERAVQRDVDDLVPLFVGHLQYRRGAAQTRIVDHYIEPAEVFHRAADQRLDLVHVGD